MNLIPEKQIFETGNYLCTWGFQASGWHKYYENISEEEDGCIGLRNGIDEEMVFGENGVLNTYPEDLRSETILVLDDGWDVPYNTKNPVNRNRFGSCDPSPDRFPNMGKTQYERLYNMVAETKRRGFKGLGLWISPQYPYAEGSAPVPYDEEKFKAHWEKNARLCGEAGIAYWKIDWGNFDNVSYSRKIITESVRKYAPALRIEHSWVGWILADSPEYRKTEDFKRKIEHVNKCMQWSDYYRTYDIDIMAHAVTLNRMTDLFKNAENVCEDGHLHRINVELQTEIAAPFGCSLGFMNHPAKTPDAHDFIKRALNWHRIAPPYSITRNKILMSDEILTDDMMRRPTDHFDDEHLFTEAPASMARGTKLPLVSADIKPFVVCSLHPDTGAFSIGTLTRTYNDDEHTDLADVTGYAASDSAYVGIFGAYKSLKIVFTESSSDCRSKKIFMQNLIEDEAVDVTSLVKAEKDSITIDGALIDRFENSAALRLI